MKNKEITIYELMGLIKDGEAPYEIIYAGTKYYISLENYYKSEDGTPLLESIFNDYNDYDALQEKVEILPEENDEWEDIEEYQYSIIPSHFDLQNAIKTINRNFETHQKALESIIKNQKYLKEKLEGKDENNK